MKMSKRERKQEVRSLIRELDSMREGYKEVGIDICFYQASNIRADIILMTTASFFIAGIIGVALCPELGIPQARPWFIVIVLMSLCCVIYCVRKHCDVLFASNFWEVNYTSASIDFLKQKIADAKHKMETYQEELNRLHLTIEKLKKLRPIIVDELGGEFELSEKFDRFMIWVTVGKRQVGEHISEESYKSVLRLIAASRKDNEEAMKLEAEIFGTKTEEG